MLDSLEITNFRTFSHLVIERLGRVNLIVGKNGVGKTTFLEALRFCAIGSPMALREYLANCEEWGIPAAAGESQLDLRALFYGRQANGLGIELGPIGNNDARIQIRLVELERVEESDGRYHFEKLENNDIPEGEVIEGVIVQHGSRQVLISPEPSRRAHLRGRYMGPAFVSAGGVREADLSYWWDEIALTPSQDRVIEALSLVAAIDGIATVADPVKAGARVFKARLRGDSAPVPLKSLGDGLVHVFQLAVALEYSQVASKDRQPSLLFDGPEDHPGQEWPRLLLVDEIENGIHHTLHADLWRFIFHAARLLDVQVFATTHSLDCLRGFAAAAAEDEKNDGLAIRLEKIEGEDQTGAVIFDRTDLPIVVRDAIEVR